jgi:hypothetical protein
MLFAIVLIVLSAAWRIVALHVPALFNFAPLMALTFCGAVYFKEKRLWLVPFVALTLSDLYLDYYYAAHFHDTWVWQSVAVRLVCFALALPIGAFVREHKNWFTLFGGALAGSIAFYVATNTDAWVRDPYYTKNFAGWVQALTVGRPEFPSTFWFFRNTLASDLLFTGVFAFAMELAAKRQQRPSLIKA